MISGDWRIAQLALQIIAEQGVGLVFAAAEAQDNAKLSSLRRKLHG